MTAPRAFPIEIKAIVGRLADRPLDLARALLPAGTRRGPEWCVAAADSPFGCSVSVHLVGSKAGVWSAWAAGKSGDGLDLIAAVKFAGDKRQAVRWALDWLRIDPQDRPHAAPSSAPAKPREPDPSAEEKRGAAFRLYLAATPLRPGDEAYDYLADTRGIDFAALGRVPRALRFFRGLTNTEAGRRFPALLAAVVGPRGRFLTVHRTWLERQSDGSVRKAPVTEPKKVYGPCRGGIIPLWRGASGRPWKQAPPGDVLGLVEGIEDALSYAVAVPEHRVAAALNVGNLAYVRLPTAIATLIIAADNDPPGSPAARTLQKAVAHFLAEGREVRIARCPAGVKDLNALLLGAG
jgi:Toprim domain